MVVAQHPCMTKSASAVVLAALVSLSAFAGEEPSLPPPPPTAQPPATPRPGVSLGYSAPRRVKYGGGPIPEYAHLETEPRKGFIIAGAAVLGASYAMSVLAGIGYCGPGRECVNGGLYIPIVGPFIVAAQAPSTGGAALATFDGVVQLAGLGLLITGFLAPDQFVVWQDADAHASLTLVPGGGGGVGVLLKY